jgi:anti-sigma B factor antagonist
MNLKLETRTANGMTVIVCHGRIMFGEEANALRDTLKQVLSNTNKVVVNLSDVNHIDSGGMGTLVGICSSARKSGADIKLAGLGKRLRDVLRTTKLATILEVYDTEEEAIAAIQHGAA